MKLILTSRDVGSAKQNLAFLEQIVNQELSLEIKILVQGPSIQIFEKSTFTYIPIEESFSVSKLSDRIFLEETINDFGPDFTLLGLSYFQIGIDEFVREFCKEKKIPCGVIQDYWGYLGQYTIDSLPDYFFVIDDKARVLTEKNTNAKVNCLVTGSPKHEQFKYKLELWSQINPFDGCEGFKILFVGQPYEMGGYIENVECLFYALNEFNSPFHLFIKEHPNNKTEIYSNILKDYSYDYKIMSQNDRVENALYHADLIVTCCSTAGFDHAYMQYYSINTLGRLLYLSIGKDIVHFFKNNVGDITISELMNGMGAVAHNLEEINTNIVDLLYHNKLDYKNAVSENLKHSMNSSKKIYNLIESSIS
jgi:hypothetical protein